jgi:hypothetical protein
MTVNRVSQSALVASSPVGLRLWPLRAAPFGAAVLAFGAPQSLAWDLRAATGALVSLAPPIFGALLFAALLTLIATAPRGVELACQRQRHEQHLADRCFP